ncbi:phosphatidate cytidylyltransferase [Spiribacter halobius]|uniref:Phosphatidate cytidylyltransferase n=1 Tax=Sediminicurvatus halobius TaxID=2182432 RepID=A0A2U2N473_9GAMM|nr:phosphatidate cytidylyltransferase [Spiribacter halobius]PWG63910.1 phosphatidate cytidylyltransferase [Spiribacter halobius]UEX76322.1 phosphatidate cytidylyltransferase [Spiribacter halobius]
MLKLRVLTALPLGLAVLWVVWGAPAAVLPGLIAAVSGLGAWEWARLGGLQAPVWRAAYCLGVLLLLGILALGGVAEGGLWVVLAVLWWLAVGGLLLAQAARGGALRLSPVWRLAAGPPTLVFAWLAFVALHAQPVAGPFLVTLLLLLVWGADIGGYFVGRAWGRHKLAPAISPGKTWEGAAGSLALALLAALTLWALAPTLGAPRPGLGWLLGASVVTVAAGIAGDLFESLLKRQAGVKDSGRLLPGHGGVLDRVDALLAAAPVLAAGLAVQA